MKQLAPTMPEADKVPGLYRRTGQYAMCVGIMRPRVIVDPMVKQEPGQHALVFHEACHAIYHHALRKLLYLVFSMIALGAALPAEHLFWTPALVGISAFCALGWFLEARACEVEADVFALDMTNLAEFVRFVYLLPHPSTRWGRWLYGKSPGERVNRVKKFWPADPAGEGTA